MATCFYCGNELILDSDFMTSEVYECADENAITSYYHCPNCGRSYEVTDPFDDEREKKSVDSFEHKK